MADVTEVSRDSTVVEGDEDDTPSLIIPVQKQSDLFVEIFPEELEGTPVSTLLQVLKDEDATIPTWVEAAWQYMQQNLKREALTILEQAADLPQGSKENKARLLASTGIAHLSQETTNSEEAHLLADHSFTQAGKVDPFFPMTWIGRGMLKLWQGQLDQATFFFETTLKQCGPILPASLGMASVQFARGDIRGALASYSSAIRKFPRKAGAPARVGLGLCCHRLGQVDRAKAAFQRALDLDHENVHAMVATALLELQSLDISQRDYGSRTERAIKLYSMANLLNHNNAMVQNHLANHYFWKWTPVPGSVATIAGSKEVKATNVSLEIGDAVRLGQLETSVVDISDDDGTITVRHPLTQSEEGLKVWKKDYDRVIALAKGAYTSTAQKGLQAESLFLLARVYHVRNTPDQAYKLYDKACALAPDLAPARFGLAQILVQRHDYSDAKKHLKQVVESSSNATDALALLGLLKVRSPKDFKEGMAHLRRAAELEPLEPRYVWLEAMALQQSSQETNFSKSLERYQTAIRLWQRRQDPIDASIWTNCGVLAHSSRQYDESAKMYRQALKALDETGFKSVATIDNRGLPGGTVRQPANDYFLGFVETDLKVEATENKKKMRVIDATEDQVSAVLEAGERISINGLVTTAVKLQNEDDSVFVMLSDDFDPMTDEGTQAQRMILSVVRENALLSIPAVITVAFNIARLHEAAGRTMAAIELHKAIARRNPAYVNSYLRLACIAVDCGALKECSEWLKIAIATAPANPEVLTLVGNLHLSLCDWQPAQNVFDGLLANKVPNVEAYASLSMGNIYFANLHVDEKRYDKHLQYASDFYRRILAKDPSNAYAANGLGTVLAEKAEIFKAKEAFNRVRQVSGDAIPDALLNLGHIYLAQKKHPEALQMYTSYMKRTEDGTSPTTSKSRVDDVVDVLVYISFCYFDWARHTELFNNADAAPADGRYKKAMDHLEMAISKDTKQKVVCQYNLCMTKLQAANCVLQKTERNIPRTVEELEVALASLEESLSMVEKFLEEKEAGARIQVSQTKMEGFVNLCRQNLNACKSHLADEKQRAEEAAIKSAARKADAEQAATEARLAKELAEAEAAAAQEERDRKAAEKMQKMESLQATWQEERDIKAADKAKRARSKGTAHDEGFIEEDVAPAAGHDLFADSDDESDTAPATNADSKEQSSNKAASDLFGSDSDSEEGKKPSDDSKPVASKGLFGDSSDEDDAKEEEPKKPAATENEGKQQATATQDLFGDSDSDEDESSTKRKADDGGEEPAAKKHRVEVEGGDN